MSLLKRYNVLKLEDQKKNKKTGNIIKENKDIIKENKDIIKENKDSSPTNVNENEFIKEDFENYKFNVKIGDSIKSYSYDHL